LIGLLKYQTDFGALCHFSVSSRSRISTARFLVILTNPIIVTMKVLPLTALFFSFLGSQDGSGSAVAFNLSTNTRSVRKNGRLPRAPHQSLKKRRPSVSSPPLFMSMSQFDITKPVFDLYSLRQVRGDALAKYSSLNQSEPLRINLAALFALTFAASPFLAPDLAGVPFTAPQTAVALAGATFSAAAFYRECQQRSRKLTRLEKELKALSLPVRLPTNLFADAAFGASVSIKQLQQKSGTRIVAVTGTTLELQAALQDLSVLGRRLTQANALVVAIPTDTSNLKDVFKVPGSGSGSGGRATRPAWLAQAGELQEWKDYFENLTENDEQQEKTFKWFGLSASSRSFGSGKGTAPEWLLLLGQHLRPVVLLDEDDPAVKIDEEVESVILQRHAVFYRALTEGNLEEMRSVCDPLDAEAVNKVVQEGGRLDEWNTCLAEGNRPAGMKVADTDVTMVSPDTAFSTCIEFPAAIEGATLLAVQKWTRRGDEWLLAKHQTIPWADRSAAGTLICDHRGCVSLVRTR
jgi:hypothetical protein